MLARVRREVRRPGGRGDQDDAKPRDEAPRLSYQRAHAPFGQARVHDQ